MAVHSTRPTEIPNDSVTPYPDRHSRPTSDLCITERLRITCNDVPCTHPLFSDSKLVNHVHSSLFCMRNKTARVGYSARISPPSHPAPPWASTYRRQDRKYTKARPPNRPQPNHAPTPRPGSRRRTTRPPQRIAAPPGAPWRPCRPPDPPSRSKRAPGVVQGRAIALRIGDLGDPAGPVAHQSVRLHELESPRTHRQATPLAR